MTLATRRFEIVRFEEKQTVSVVFCKGLRNNSDQFFYVSSRKRGQNSSNLCNFSSNLMQFFFLRRPPAYPESRHYESSSV